MANRGWRYPFGEDPNSVMPEILGRDYFGDEVVEGDEYWIINGDEVLDENLREYIDRKFTQVIFKDRNGYWDINGEHVPDGEELNYVMENFEMRVADIY